MAPPSRDSAAGPELEGDEPPVAESSRAASAVFAVLLVLAVPIVLFGVGSYHWFFRDDFWFLTDRRASSLADWFRPHDAHWTTVPVLAFRALWAIFGLRTYVPYQATVLCLHLAACALLRIIMRRAGVGPWLATAAAASFILFGPGEQNIVWAFQIGFTGALTFGLAHLVLMDHDGPVDRRDAFGLAAGVLALLSSGVGVTMAIVAALATLGRRGWRVALLHTVPLACMYIVWSSIEHPTLTSVFGRPSIGVVYDWVRSGEIGVFLALGHFQIVAALLALVLVTGLVVAFSPVGMKTVRRVSIPVAMLVGSLVFSASAAFGRWLNGPSFARSSRYLHIGTALTLPALALAIDALARRWRWGWRALGVAPVALLLVAIPWNATNFGEDSTFGSSYMKYHRSFLTNIVRLPEAEQVPRDVRPLPDIYLGPKLTIGFLLDAVKAGKLKPGTRRLSPTMQHQLLLSLAVAQEQQGKTTKCRQVARPLDEKPAKGAVYGIQSQLAVSLRTPNAPPAAVLNFNPINGDSLTIELSGLALRFAPVKGASSFTLCEITQSG